MTPSFRCLAVTAALLVPATSWAQPPPDPPPPGLHGSEPTRLEPDKQPARARSVSPAPPAPVKETVAPAAVEEATAGRIIEKPQVQAPRPASKQVQAPQPAPKQVPRARPAAREFSLSQKPPRRAPRAAATLPLLSSDTDSRPHLLAALSLAVLALGSGTLLTVLTRLRSTKQGLA